MNDWFSMLSIICRCNGQSDCGMVVNPINFGGDPCPGTSKYLSVEHRCEAERKLTMCTTEHQAHSVHCYYIDFKIYLGLMVTG